MGWVNVRRRTVVDFEIDPNARYVLGLGRSILRRVQGVGLHSVLGADGDPETSYGGSYGPPVQAELLGAATGIATPSVIRDMGGADIASGVTDSGSSASRAFAERLRRGRVS